MKRSITKDEILVSSRINDILNLEKELLQEKQSHLQLKADLSRKITESTTEETSLSERLTTLQESVLTGEKKESTVTVDISQLIHTQNRLEDEINQLKEGIAPLEQQLAQLNADRGIIDSKIEVLLQEKKEQERKALELKSKHEKTKRTSNKVLNERERLKKIRTRIEDQKKIKENLDTFLKTLNSIQQVVINYSPLTESKVSLPSDVTDEIQKQIIHAKKCFDEAQTSFDPNNLVPFLVDADESYQKIVSAFIKMCDNIPNSLLERNFSEQILKLVEKGLMLNTRHLNAVESMLSKLEKGVEIAPLASFSNEIKKYFVENLTYLRITGWVVLEPPPS